MEAMLLWSKGQMQQLKPQIASVQIDDAFNYLRKYFSDDERIQFSFENDEHLNVQTDENYLKSIMLNLTANAVKALGQTVNPQIHWKAWQESKAINISVRDNGPGASDEQLKALYDEGASSGGRHGLGLHIIRDLAKAIDCTINLKSHGVDGTEFVLSITRENHSTSIS
jgi:C4-dicarboxylate-specific signal transduction histidine kinase